MFDLLVKNGRIVDDDRVYYGNIYVKDGKIALISERNIEFESADVVDACDKLILPGVVDAHMHIGEYNADFEDIQTSTMAAAAGGVTTCIDMPLNLYSPSVLTAEAVRLKKRLLSQESFVDFCVWGGLTPQSIENLNEMHKEGAISFKCFLSGGGNDFYAPTLGEVRQALMTIKKFDGLAGFHCEDYSIVAYEKERVLKNKLDGRQAFLNSRPLSCEIIAVRNIIELARETGAKVHICHVSHPDVAKIIEEDKSEGIDITAETCVHYLTFTQNDYLKNGCAFGCAPPLRDENSREGLWNYINRGVLSCVVSDHSPGMPENRSDQHQPTYMSGYGISGVQTMLPVFYDGVIKHGMPVTLAAKCMSSNPAKRWGIYGKKGAVKTGFDADFVIFDDKTEHTICADNLFYKVKLTAFDGLKVKGKVEQTFIRGISVYCNEKIAVKKGFGKFIELEKQI